MTAEALPALPLLARRRLVSSLGARRGRSADKKQAVLGGVALRTHAELPEDSSRASAPNRLHFDSFPPPFPQPLQKKKIWFAITLLHSLQHHPSVESWEIPSPSPASSLSPGCQSCYDHWYFCRNSRVGAEWKEMLPS